MSVIHVNHIRSTLNKLFNGKVDLSDCHAAQVDSMFATRALAAYSLMQCAELTAESAADGITDGFGDNGIDALHFDRADRVLYVVQSKWMGDGNGSPELGDVVKFCNGFRDLMFGRFERFNPQLRRHQADIEAALEDVSARFVLALSYTGQQPLSEHAVRALQDLLDEVNDTSELVSYVVHDQRQLHWAVTGHARGDPISIDIRLLEWGLVREPYEAYYGQVDAGQINAWWKEHGARLFERNLRKFSGNTEVNQAISDTLQDNARHFWYFNNGITMLCNRIAKTPAAPGDRSAGLFKCEGVTVVNGAQTVGCIGRLPDEPQSEAGQASVLVRLISLENAPDDLDISITRSTNLQNRVEKRDFVALDPEQSRLQMDLHFEGKRYVYKTGDADPGTDGCTLVEAATALACADPDVNLAVQAKREIGRLWDDISRVPYKKLFNASLTGQRLWRAVEVQRAVEAQLRSERRSSGRENLIAVHGNRFVAHVVFQKLDLDTADVDVDDLKRQAREHTLKVLPAVIAVVGSKYPNSYPASLFKNATKCRDLARTLTGGVGM